MLASCPAWLAATLTKGRSVVTLWRLTIKRRSAR